MKTTICLLFLCALLASCAGPGQGPAAQVQAFLEVALADHVLSGEELSQLTALIGKLADAESSQIGWEELITGLATTAVSSVLGINLWRNKTRAKALQTVQIDSAIAAMKEPK